MKEISKIIKCTDLEKLLFLMMKFMTDNSLIIKFITKDYFSVKMFKYKAYGITIFFKKSLKKNPKIEEND